jgi:hypothetical protein
VHYVGSATAAREVSLALTCHDVRIAVESEHVDAACRTHQEDPRTEPTKSALLGRLFEEAARDAPDELHQDGFLVWRKLERHL